MLFVLVAFTLGAPSVFGQTTSLRGQVRITDAIHVLI